MIPNNYKDSLFISDQLPQFVRDEADYQTFISFLEAYYEFLETDKNVLDLSKNLLNYKDVDNTLEEFHKYFFNEFLQYFPEEIVNNKIDLVKYARELYQRKSTPASFKFLFRALYNSDCDTVNTRDFVLIPSDGKWQISRFIRLNTLDPNFLNLKNYKLFGETSKAIAKIENSQVLSNRTEIFVSDIIREFTSGEFVKIVDDKLKDVLFNGQVLRAKVTGIIAKIDIDPENPGLKYKPQDPIVIYGGLNLEIDNPVSAKAEVGTVSTGSVKTVSLLEGSSGFRAYPNTIINVSGGGGGTGLDVRVSSLDTQNVAHVSLITTDFIQPYSNILLDVVNYNFPNFYSANANTRLVDALSSISLDTYPINGVVLSNPGLNYSEEPVLTAISTFTENNFTYDLKQYGILAPIKVRFGGYNYSNNDEVILTGGSGIGAYARIGLVDSNGSIQKIEYYENANNLYPLGGMGYRNNALPNINIDSANNKIFYQQTSDYGDFNTNVLYFSNTSNLIKGMYVSGEGIHQTKTLDYFESNVRIANVSTNSIELTANLTQEILPGTTYKFDGSAVVSLTSILGDGAKFGLSYDSIGAIRTINLLDSGEDYISSPTISLKILDIAVTEINESFIPSRGDFIYQGPSVRGFTFGAYIETVSLIGSTYFIRLYDYVGTINKDLNFYVDKEGENSKTLSYTLKNNYGQNGFVSGIRVFGDGKAKANGNFINGTVNLQGKYLNSDGFLSDSNYIQSEIYNFYSYFLIVEQAFFEYKELVKNILNPASKQLISIDSEKSNTKVQLKNNIDLFKNIELKDVTNPIIREIFVGGLKNINIVNGSYGYRLYPNGSIIVNPTDTIGYGAELRIDGVDTSNISPVSLINVDIIRPYESTLIRSQNYGFPNFSSANANTRLIDAFTSVTFDTYPISSLVVDDYGFNYANPPQIQAFSTFTYGANTYDLSTFGILSPIQVNYGGYNYSNGDVVILQGGSGFGSYANVKSVDSNGSIQSVQYIQREDSLYPLGGLGYTSNSLPSIAVISSNNKTLYLQSNNTIDVGNTIIYTTSSLTNVKSGMYVYGVGLSNTTFVTDVGGDYIEISEPLEIEVVSGNTYIIDGTANLFIYSVLGDKAVISSETEQTNKVEVKLTGVLIDENALKIYELRKELTGILLSAVLTPNDYIHLVSTNGEEFFSEIKSIDDSNDIIYLKDYNKLYFANVAYGYANANSVVISNTTNTYELYYGENYSNTLNKLESIFYVNDYLYISNNKQITINNVDYANSKIYANNVIYESGNVVNPQLISVKRSFVTNNIYITYNLDYKDLVGSGNTVTGIDLEGIHLTDDANNIIFIPLH